MCAVYRRRQGSRRGIRRLSVNARRWSVGCAKDIWLLHRMTMLM
jgi:hypothetical protein